MQVSDKPTRLSMMLAGNLLSRIIEGTCCVLVGLRQGSSDIGFANYRYMYCKFPV